jgi:uncharacterized membrane protein YadS
MTTTTIHSPPFPSKKPLLTRFFNVLHYSTVALLVGSSVFLVANVIGAAQAKKKSFREERAKALAEFETFEQANKDVKN